MSVLGWWLTAASVANFSKFLGSLVVDSELTRNPVSAMMLGMVTMWHPDYEIKNWHQWLCYAAVVWLAVAVNVFASKLIPLFNKFISQYRMPAI